MRTKHLTRLALPAIAAAALTGVVATPSYAAAPTASVVNGNDVLYVGSDEFDEIKVTSSGPFVFLEALGSGVIDNGPGCTQETFVRNKVTCQATTSIDFIQLQMNGGPDEVRVDTSIATRIEGGAGRDIYFGASARTGTNVTFNGGDDVDTADFGFSTSGVLVDMDGQADDGRLNVDHDNIGTTVENLLGSDFDDSLRGNSNKNWIVGREGADALRGGNNDDEIWAMETAGTDGSKADKPDLSCGTGNDIIQVDLTDPQVSGDCETVDRR
ncbi:hypothetical protein [Nonomuraea sp. B19D2]|uniref:hypothetical protein n=1 Tax=Nonomuraea sp. B19D2 TaxID=3159561 RepID=UPI0032DA1C75